MQQTTQINKYVDGIGQRVTEVQRLVIYFVYCKSFVDTFSKNLFLFRRMTTYYGQLENSQLLSKPYQTLMPLKNLVFHVFWTNFLCFDFSF